MTFIDPARVTPTSEFHVTGVQPDLTTLPLYKIERDALADSGSLDELVRRYVADHSRAWATSPAHLARIKTAWLSGWHGEPSAYRHGNNFAAPYKRAYIDGKRKRHELEVALAGGAW